MVICVHVLPKAGFRSIMINFLILQSFPYRAPLKSNRAFLYSRSSTDKIEEKQNNLKGFEGVYVNFTGNWTCERRPSLPTESTTCSSRNHTATESFHLFGKCTSLYVTFHLDSWISEQLSWDSVQNLISGQ